MQLNQLIDCVQKFSDENDLTTCNEMQILQQDPFKVPDLDNQIANIQDISMDESNTDELPLTNEVQAINNPNSEEFIHKIKGNVIK